MRVLGSCIGRLSWQNIEVELSKVIISMCFKASVILVPVCRLSIIGCFIHVASYTEATPSSTSKVDCLDFKKVY